MLLGGLPHKAPSSTACGLPEGRVSGAGRPMTNLVQICDPFWHPCHTWPFQRSYSLSLFWLLLVRILVTGTDAKKELLCKGPVSCCCGSWQLLPPTDVKAAALCRQTSQFQFLEALCRACYFGHLAVSKRPQSWFSYCPQYRSSHDTGCDISELASPVMANRAKPTAPQTWEGPSNWVGSLAKALLAFG